MRRAVLEGVGGYKALKDEIMEAVRLAEMIKRSGKSLLNLAAFGIVVAFRR